MCNVKRLKYNVYHTSLSRHRFNHTKQKLLNHRRMSPFHIDQRSMPLQKIADISVSTFAVKNDETVAMGENPPPDPFSWLVKGRRRSHGNHQNLSPIFHLFQNLSIPRIQPTEEISQTRLLKKTEVYLRELKST